jgi:hypothetical protein
MLERQPNDKQLEICKEYILKHRAARQPQGDMMRLRALQAYDRFVIFGRDKCAGYIALTPQIKARDVVEMVVNYEPFDRKCGVHRAQYENIQKRLNTLESYYKRLLGAR